jgi:hypothetical protein
MLKLCLEHHHGYCDVAKLFQHGSVLKHHAKSNGLAKYIIHHDTLNNTYSVP